MQIIRSGDNCKTQRLSQIDRFFFQCTNGTVSGASFLTKCVLECDIAYHRSMAVLCKMYKIRCTRCALFIVLYRCHMWQCGIVQASLSGTLHTDDLWSHIGTPIPLLAAGPPRTEELLLTSQYPRVSIWATIYSMVWDWRIPGQCFFIGLAYSLFFFVLFYTSAFISFFLWVGRAGVFGLYKGWK